LPLAYRSSGLPVEALLCTSTSAAFMLLLLLPKKRNRMTITQLPLLRLLRLLLQNKMKMMMRLLLPKLDDLAPNDDADVIVDAASVNK